MEFARDEADADWISVLPYVEIGVVTGFSDASKLINPRATGGNGLGS
jgi:hypothetical protein